jgi:hypothetical protein
MRKTGQGGNIVPGEGDGRGLAPSPMRIVWFMVRKHQGLLRIDTHKFHPLSC